jgi:hypothetical protein
MKPERLMLAGIVTVVCSSLSSFDAGAALSDSPAIATGQVITTMQGAPQDAQQEAPSAAVPAVPAVPAVSDSSIPDSAGNTVESASTVPADALAPVKDEAAPTAASDPDPEWATSDLVAVSEVRLDDMRGGFDLPSGLLVSFGISRAAFVNGNLVAQTSFNIPDIANMTAQQAQMLANVNVGALIQVGPHNSVQQGAMPALTGALIQNTLNDQQIQALTTINTSVNTLSAFKAMNFLSTLNSALSSVVRPR